MSEPETEPVAPDAEPEVEPVADEPGVSDDEAAEAEEAEQADEQAAADEPEQAQEPSGEPESPTDKKRMQAAQRAVSSYAKKIGEIFEEQSQELLPCPLCGDTVWPGFVHLADAGRMPDVTKNAVMQFLGYAREREYQTVAAYHACSDCGGLGKVQTGSQVAGKETITCPTCLGNGYLGAAGPPSNGAVQVEGVVTGPTMVPSGAGVPDVDPTGEPRLLPDGRENPNYGKWPQYKVPIEPWGTTANLTVQDAVT